MQFNRSHMGYNVSNKDLKLKLEDTGTFKDSASNRSKLKLMNFKDNVVNLTLS